MTLAQIFMQVCWMSVTATIVAVPVMVLLGLFSHWKVPKRACCLLYALVLFRMVCPLSLPGEWGLFSLPWIQEVQQGTVDLFDGYSGEYEVAIEGSEAYEQAMAAGLTPERIIKDSPQSILYVPYRMDAEGAFVPAQTAMETWVPWVARAWLAGAGVFYGLTILSYVLLRRRLRFAVKEEEGVYVSDRIPSPCVVGYFRPRIYLVPGLSAEERAHILAHERAHLRRGDQWAKLIAWLALGIHWFNIYLWMVYRVFCSDLEQACDERVMRAADMEARKAYSRTLLNLSYDRRFRWLNPVAFAEGGTKERVNHVLHLGKAKPALLALAAAAAIAVVVLCVSGGAQQSGEKTVPTVIDHTGTLTEQQIAALEARDWDYMGLDPSLEWVNTKGFSTMEILTVREEDGVYTMEVLQGSALFSWLLHGTAHDGGVAGWYFGIPMACRETMVWDGKQFTFLNTESVGETVQTGDEELDVSGFSEEARQCMEETGAGLASVVKNLCRQAESWYGCGVYQSYVLRDGLHYGVFFIMEDGTWNFSELRGNAVQDTEGNLAPLRELGRSPAGTDTSLWSDEQLVWALGSAEGTFAEEAAKVLYERFESAPKDILQEVTALGAAERDVVCWALAEQWCAAHGAEESILSAVKLQGCTKAVQETAQRMETARAVIAEGGSAWPAEEETNASGWVVVGSSSAEVA